MENRLYTIDEVAQLLGKTPSEVNELRTQGKIYGLRDGGTWKFKGPDVEKLVNPPKEEAYDEDFALVAGESSLELDAVDSPDEGGTVIGGADKSVNLDLTNGSSLDLSPSALDINSTLDNDTTAHSLQEESSVLDIGEADLVLGESDIMSDVTLNGESSGINLYKPEGDSGISLDGDGLNNGSAALDADSLNVNLDDLVLDDNDSLSIIDDGSSMMEDAVTGGEGDFTLTTTPDDTEDESETGSQVIALSESSSDISDPLMGVGPGAIDNHDGLDMGLNDGGASGGTIYNEVLPPGVTPELIAAAQEIGLKEKPYSIWNILSLLLCVILLVMTMIMTVDLVRNMWSWNQPYTINSNLMDWLLSYFG